MHPLKSRIKRFTLVQRIFHALLMIAFLVLGATGLSRMYMNTSWGNWLGNLFGGYESSLMVHISLGIVMIVGFLIHSVYLVVKIDWKNFPQSLAGPDSLLPRPKDVVDFFKHVGWFLGMNQHPSFDRWGYWEKFDYWAVFWGMAIIGLTGLMMAFPLVATRYMPGWGLNVAFWVHRIEAILALAHVFIIHFFVAHLRRHHFPMDRAIFEGSADLNAIKTEKPAWLDRLKNSGTLDSMLVAEAAPLRIGVFYLLGYAMVAAGLFLLIGAVVNVRSVLW